MCDFILREYDIFLKKNILKCTVYGGDCKTKCRLSHKD